MPSGGLVNETIFKIQKKCDYLVTEIQDQLEQGAKSRGVWGGATESDHEQGLGRGQPFLDIDLSYCCRNKASKISLSCSTHNHTPSATGEHTC